MQGSDCQNSTAKIPHCASPALLPSPMGAGAKTSPTGSPMPRASPSRPCSGPHCPFPNTVAWLCSHAGPQPPSCFLFQSASCSTPGLAYRPQTCASHRSGVGTARQRGRAYQKACQVPQSVIAASGGRWALPEHPALSWGEDRLGLSGAVQIWSRILVTSQMQGPSALGAALPLKYPCTSPVTGG